MPPAPALWRGWFQRADGATILLVLGLKILLFVFAAQAFTVLANRDLGWLEMWSRWDARIYLGLAREG